MRNPAFALWALLLGNLVIGTGVLLPAGMLTAFMAGYAIDASRAGQLMLVGGIVVGIGAPLLASLTSAIDRRLLLTTALCLYVAGHIGATLTTDFTALLVFRALTVTGAAIYTPQAAATVGLLVPPEKRAGAIAFIFIGWSLASVAGIPLGSYLGEAIGWRQTFLGMAALSALAAIAGWLALPPGLFVTRIDLRAWVRVLTDPVLLIVLLVTLFSMSGQFTLFTYITPVLKSVYGATAAQVAFAFLLTGACGVLGNFIGARAAGRIGVGASVLISLITIAAGFAVIALGWASFPAYVAGGVLWGLGTFASNSLQQSRLVALAPPLASATVALNTSVVYLGQSLGSATGGWLIAGGAGPAMPWSGAGFFALAIAASVLASLLARRIRGE